MAGLAGVVDDIGGLPFCADTSMRDTVTGMAVPAGCQPLDGTRALTLARMRAGNATPGGELDRVVNQRRLLGTLADTAALPGAELRPAGAARLLWHGPRRLTVDADCHLPSLLRLGWALRGTPAHGASLTVPTAAPGDPTSRWDPDRARRLFDALRADSEIPEDVRAG
jgi:hypothetical protein